LWRYASISSKPSDPVEPACGLHRRERVEAHETVAGLAARLDDRLGEAPAEPRPLEGRPHIEPFHLADIGLVRPERDAARGLVIVEGKQQSAARRRVVARQLA